MPVKWDIRAEGRAWGRDEAAERWALTPEKLEICGQRGLSLQMTAFLPTLDAMKQAVAVGLGITILPRRTVLQEIADGRLHDIPLAESWAEEDVWFAHNAEHALPEVGEVFVELLREVSATMLAVTRT